MKILKKVRLSKYVNGFVTVRDGIATMTVLPHGGETFQATFPVRGRLNGAARIDSVSAAVKALGTERDFGTIGEDYGGYHLVTVPIEDAPADLEPATGPTFVVDGPKFMDAWKWAEIAAASEKSRFGFKGVCIIGSTVYGTDGKRLHYAEVDGIDAPKTLVSLSIGRFLEVFGTKESVRITFGSDRFTVQVGSAKITAMNVDGLYPDVKAVIPKESGTRVPMAPIAEHAKKGKPFTSRESSAMKIQTIDGRVHVRCQKPDVGTYDGDTGIEADVVGVAFNPDYFIDACPKKTTPTIRWSKPNQPATVEIGDGRHAVLMPITLRNG